MIEIKKLCKSYNKQEVLEDIDYKFNERGLICLLGPSGCGKSTLLNILAGFDTQYEGEIIVCGSAINKMTTNQLCEYRKNNIGFVFQNYHLLQGYTVIENILLACVNHSSDTTVNIKKASELLNKLDILDKINEKVENLSGGQKQRVAIARALINEPSIILADEPTGALDRENSTEIIMLLKAISKDCLVLVITHDKKINEYADLSISIQDKKIVGEIDNEVSIIKKQLKSDSMTKINTYQCSIKNFKVHFKRFVAISFAISIGVFIFMLSLSSKNIIQQSIFDFKDKNIAYNNGYIKIDKDPNIVLIQLSSDSRINNIYKQYRIHNITLSMNDKTEIIKDKYPMPKAKEKMSYGTMPITNKNQISLSPSLAKKFNNNISELINKKIKVTYNQKEYTLSVSGIFNADYDDFFISNDIEKSFYKNINNQETYSISYDVKNFNDIVSVNENLKKIKINADNASDEVKALQITFTQLARLFFIVSLFIFIVGVFITTTLLVKLQNSRYREIGLLSALGFNRTTIRKIIIYENILLSMMSIAFHTTLMIIAYLISNLLTINLNITIPQILISTLSTGIIVIIISIIASYKLINTDPAIALKQ